MTDTQAIEKARAYFLTEENIHGCAETTLIVLQEAYGLPDPADSSPAMALNGGVAWRGGICGAISSAAMAVGRLASRRIPDHKEAKRAARCITASLMDRFSQEFGHLNCQDLTGLDISTVEGHTAFIESKIWHGLCMAHIEFALRWLVPLQDETTWQETLNKCEP